MRRQLRGHRICDCLVPFVHCGSVVVAWKRHGLTRIICSLRCSIMMQVRRRQTPCRESMSSWLHSCGTVTVRGAAMVQARFLFDCCGAWFVCLFVCLIVCLSDSLFCLFVCCCYFLPLLYFFLSFFFFFNLVLLNGQNGPRYQRVLAFCLLLLFLTGTMPKGLIL